MWKVVCRLRALVLCFLLLPGASAQSQTVPPIRIMPLGDSITDGTANGTAGMGGYRGPLYTLLTNAGYNVDYVGTLNNNGSLIPDKDHEGHSGWRIDQLDTNMVGWLGSLADPDVVLMHIGTNDFGQNFSIATAINRLDALILKIATLRPYAHIVVTNLMERGEPANTNIVNQFNPYVQGVVNAHAAAGRRVTFLDMRSVVALLLMPDSLHPNQTGYNQMAAAWLGAVQAVIGPQGDTAPPQLVRAQGQADRTHVALTFSKPVADTAVQGSFALSGGLGVAGAALDATKRIVTLTTTNPMTIGNSYTVTVSGVTDRQATPTAMTAEGTASFSAAIARGYGNHVAEAAEYTLAYSLDVPSVANYATVAPAYTVDNHLNIGPFDRVAYWVELQSGTGDLQYLWASMDAFTSDLGKVAVPTVASGAVFQQGVTNLNVVSNVAGVTNGTGMAGNLEFWPTSYTQANGANVAGASATLYDFGDTRSTTGAFGSMQLHNTGAQQTLFAFNDWGGSATTTAADLGLGSQLANNPDWTFAANAGNYTVKTIQVLVRTTHDLTPPAIVSTVASFAGTSLTITFSEPLTAASVLAGNFTLSNGLSVLTATLSANQREVILTTTAQPAGVPLTLTVGGVRDASANANRVVAGTTATVSPAVLPAEILANAGAAAAGYQVVCTLNLPATGNLNAAGSGAYTVDERTAGGPFTRVAYYLELQKAGAASQFVWVSMDAFTTNRAKLGVPTLATGALWQKSVSNLEVVSNVAGVTTGSGIAAGNLEFWPSNYTATKAAASPASASDTTYDFGDSGAALTAGFGCMQIHNTGAGQTLLAINHFGTDGSTLDVGIGTQSTGSPDWTNAANAGAYTRRLLHVLVLPGVTAPPAVVSRVPEAAGYQLAATVNIPDKGNLNNASIYAVDNRADLGAFSRIAYYLELKKPTDAESSFVWTSMDAFTTDPTKIGVPTSASGAVFQQNVANLNVVSNVAGVINGTGLATGNIEFWPSNYLPARAAASPANADTLTLDFGDTINGTGAGHGSMQVHNYGAAQTLLSLTNWGSTTSTTNLFGLGIGNDPAPVSGGVDWTFAANSATFDTRVLHIFVKPGSADTTPPAIVRVTPSTELNRLVVTFSEPLAETTAGASFALSGGLTVKSATLLASKSEVMLTTTPQTPGASYTLTVSGVRDRTAGNLIATGASASFTGYSPPAIFASVPETANYRLIYQLALPTTSPKWNTNTIPYAVDESRYGEQGFDRVAYLLELDGRWVYASFDPFTSSIGKIGIPTPSVTSTAFQQNVTHLNVASNVSGIVTGTDLAGGNIEFWSGNYSAPNALNITGASATTMDFGDTMTAGSYGCMQVHNHDAGQTLFAYNNWGAAAAVSELGIGNNPTAGAAGTGGTQMPDWTFTPTATNYTTRNLYVLAHAAALTPSGTPPTLISQPSARLLGPGAATTLAVAVSGTGTFTYQWYRDGSVIDGATNPWLDLTDVRASQTGSYYAVVTTATGAATTSQASVISLSNHLPQFAGFSFTMRRGETAVLSQAQLLGKASDADGDGLTLSGVVAASAQGGTVAMQGGALSYTPPAGFLGADSFTVKIADGQAGEITGTVTVQVTGAAISPAGRPTLGVRGDGKLDVLFPGAPGKRYRIERSTDLQSWSAVQTVAPGDDGLVPFTDGNPPTGRVFYRATEEP